jgi:hypothetical protein
MRSPGWPQGSDTGRHSLSPLGASSRGSHSAAEHPAQTGVVVIRSFARDSLTQGSKLAQSSLTPANASIPKTHLPPADNVAQALCIPQQKTPRANHLSVVQHLHNASIIVISMNSLSRTSVGSKQASLTDHTWGSSSMQTCSAWQSDLPKGESSHTANLNGLRQRGQPLQQTAHHAHPIRCIRCQPRPVGCLLSCTCTQGHAPLTNPAQSLSIGVWHVISLLHTPSELVT